MIQIVVAFGIQSALHEFRKVSKKFELNLLPD